MYPELEIFAEEEYVSFISKRIQNIQVKLNKSNLQMANIFEVTESTYNRYLTSDIKIPAFRCMRLVLTNNIDANYLFGSNQSEKMFLNKDFTYINTAMTLFSNDPF